MTEAEVDLQAKILWDYLQMHQQLRKAEAILVLGSHDFRVADRGVDLFLQGYAPLLIFSGGVGRLTKDTFTQSEAELFSQRALLRGIPAQNILIENQSTNTGENIQFTKELLKEKKLELHNLIVVHKPYMERRAWATIKKVWPEMQICMTSPQIPYEAYPIPTIPKEEMIAIMVGDLQRIKIYPAFSYQVVQDIPPDVWQAYQRLVELGYTKHLIRV